MKNTSLRDLAEFLDAPCTSSCLIEGYRIDSRLVEKGDLFFALEGNRVDGHLFLQQAAKRGAVSAVVRKEYSGPDFGLSLIRVEHVELALQTLARKMMQKKRPLIAAITGSLGKTTTKEFAATLLEGKFRVGKSFLNNNSKLTYPLTLLNRTGLEEVLVVEMGMSEPGDITRLVNIAAPDIAVLTKVAWVHGAFFPEGIAQIAKEKAKIFSKACTRVCIFDHDLFFYKEAIAECEERKKVSFSLINKEADFFFSEGVLHEREIGVAKIRLPFKEVHISHNFLAAASLAREMGMSWEEIESRIAQLKKTEMRFESLEKRGVLFINDAYNASPDSVRAALLSLPEPKKGGRKIAVLGMMVDMGTESDRIHREVGEFAKSRVDMLFAFRSHAIAEGFGEAEVFSEMEELAGRLKELICPGDVVLLKGSRILQMERLLQLCS